jgi:Domain of unknown function (DUF1902)
MTIFQFDQVNSENTVPDLRRAPFVADVVYDADCRTWVASCDALGVVTEAPGYEALTARFWSIAAEMAAENGIEFDARSRVQFRQVTTCP